MKHYFENGIYCIYLDQFAVSDMFGNQDKPEWDEIKKQLILGFHNNRIICPLSNEHFLESSQMDYQSAIQLDREFCNLSNGYVFKSELLITSQLLISTIRGNNITKNTYLHKNVERNILSQMDNTKQFRKLKEQLNSKINEATSFANELREVSRKTKTDTDTTELLINNHKSLNVKHFIARLNDLIQNKEIVTRRMHFESGDVPNWIDLIIQRLKNTHRMNLKETNAQVLHIKKNGFNKIPTLDIRTTLSALISVFNKKESVNDQVDIMRISTGLPISDILLTDKKRKNEIIISGLNKKYMTRVYSGTSEDIQMLIEDLRIINK